MSDDSISERSSSRNPWASSLADDSDSSSSSSGSSSRVGQAPPSGYEKH